LAVGSEVTLWLNPDRKTAKYVKLGLRKKTGTRERK
jgi:hypothetical protein